MKVATKSASVESEDSASATAEVGSTAQVSTSGGSEAYKEIPLTGTPASKTPMVRTFVDVDRFQRRLVANGYGIPRVPLPDRAISVWSQKLRLSFHLTTPEDPDVIALRWLRNFEARETSGRVAAIKARIKFDSESIRRWVQQTE